MTALLKIRIWILIFTPVLTTIFVLLSIPTKTNSAGPWYVAPSGDDSNNCLSPETACRSITAAINKAWFGDVINLAAGVYVENIVIDKSLTLSGAGKGSTIIDGNFNDTVIRIHGAGTVEIKNLTIMNGAAPAFGGGIRSNSGNLTLSNLEIVNNTANEKGGGIYAYLGTGNLTLIDTSVINNSINDGTNSFELAGGGIYCQCNLDIVRSDISYNTNPSGEGGGVAAVSGFLVVAIHDSTITHNSAASYGGIIAGGRSNLIINSDISDNTATEGFGGGARTTGQTTIINSTLSGNIAEAGGGGIYNRATLTITLQSEISTNSALNGNGGGILNDSSANVTINQSTILNNSARSGGGISNRFGVVHIEQSQILQNSSAQSGGGISNGDEMEIVNSIISDNVSAGGGAGISNGGILAVTSSTISGNVGETNDGIGDGRGAGIYSYAHESLKIFNNIITNNHSVTGAGGGIGCEFGNQKTTTILANFISGNESATGSGGIYLLRCDGRIFGNTITGNKGIGGSGLYVNNSNVAANMNCIVENDGRDVYANSYNSPLDATANWWGASPPSPGSMGHTVYEPWLHAPPYNCTIQPPPVPVPLPEPGTVDLRVKKIEVNQVSMTDDILLISGKPTLVRVFVEAVGSPSVPLVTARLIISTTQETHIVNETFDHPFITAVENPNINSHNLADTLNFLIDEDWLDGNVILQAEVDPYDLIQEYNEGNNMGSPVPKLFQQAKPLTIAYIPIHYEPVPSACSTEGDTEPSRDLIHKAVSWAGKVFPTDNLHYFRLTKIDWDLPLRSLDSQGKCQFNRTSEERLFNGLTLLYRWRWLFTLNTQVDYVFGWLPDDAYENGGYSDPSWRNGGSGAGVAAFGEADPSEGQLIFAHEIAHLMNRRHSNSTANLDDSNCRINPDGTTDEEMAFVDGDSDWPFLNSKLQSTGIDFLTTPVQLYNAENSYDFMSYCGSLSKKNVWASPFTFERIFNETLRNTTTTFQENSLSGSAHLLVSGLIFANDEAILDPIWVVTPTVNIPTPPGGNQYCLEAQSELGNVLASQCFDMEFVDHETFEPTNVRGFNLILPYLNGTYRIVLKKGDQELIERIVSSNKPSISLLSPNGGEIINAGETFTVTWSASDADNDPLFYTVLYSQDEINWIPLTVTITETQFVANAAELPGSNTARIRVVVSDGINTSMDDSDTSFTIGRKGPNAYILMPEDDLIVSPQIPIMFQGYAYDLEDGALDENVLKWHSDLDGEIGNGQRVITYLSLGEHIITFTATDSDGNVGTATITVVVEESTQRIYLPVISKH